MATFETYQAKADPEIALSLAGTTSPFTIEVRFLGGLTQQQMDAFKGAADRWSRMIVGDLPDILVDGQRIDDGVDGEQLIDRAARVAQPCVRAEIDERVPLVAEKQRS